MNWQLQHTIKKCSVFIRTKSFVMDLKKCWDDIENWSLTYDLQVAIWFNSFRFLPAFVLFMIFYSIFFPFWVFPLFFTGPTSFAPIIEMAITIVEHSGGQYHVLVIIADGQVQRLCSMILNYGWKTIIYCHELYNWGIFLSLKTDMIWGFWFWVSGKT